MDLAHGKELGLVGINFLLSCLLVQGMVRESIFYITFGVGITH